MLVNAPILNSKASGFPDPERLPTPLVSTGRPAGRADDQLSRPQGVVHGLLIWTSMATVARRSRRGGGSACTGTGAGTDGRWTRTSLAEGEPAPYPDGGASDLGAGRLGSEQFFAAIEPFHGNKVVVYRQRGQGGWQRQVIDTEVANGHSMAVGDLDGDGNAEIVAGGTRGRSVYLYRIAGAEGERWERTVLDADWPQRLRDGRHRRRRRHRRDLHRRGEPLESEVVRDASPVPAFDPGGWAVALKIAAAAWPS